MLHSNREEDAMTLLVKMLATITFSTLLATNALAQSAREVRGASPYVAVENEPAPKLIVDRPLPEGLAIGLFWVQYRVENMHIAPVFGEALSRHLHVSGTCT